MRDFEYFMTIGIAGVLVSVLGFVLWPKEQDSRWSGRQRTQISVHLDGIPNAAPVEVFVWNGNEERSLGVTDITGRVTGTVKLFAGGSDHRTTVNLYSELLVVRTQGSGELLKAIPLESCTIRGGAEVTRPVHQVWIHVDYLQVESVHDYPHYGLIQNHTPHGE